MPTLDKVLIVRNIDGTFSRTFFIKEAIPKGKTEDEFIASETKRVLDNLGNPNEFFIKNKSDLKLISSQAINNKKRSIRCDKNGNLFIDANYKSPKEILDENKSVIRQKLKSGELLNDNDIDILLGK